MGLTVMWTTTMSELKNRPQDLKDVPYEWLPKSIFPRMMHIETIGSDIVDRTCGKPTKTKDVPKNVSIGMQKRMSNLAQHKGRTVEGNRKSISNFRVRRKNLTKDIEKVEPTDKVPAPKIPTGLPTVSPDQLLRSSYTKMVMSQEEYNIYMDEWNNWFNGVGGDRFTHHEDRRDIEKLCMLSVQQHRLYRRSNQNQDVDYTEQELKYHRMEQECRKNLAARRVDREGTANRNNNVTNIAMFSNVESDEIQQQIKKIDSEVNELFSGRSSRHNKSFIDALTSDELELDELEYEDDNADT